MDMQKWGWKCIKRDSWAERGVLVCFLVAEMKKVKGPTYRSPSRTVRRLARQLHFDDNGKYYKRQESQANSILAKRERMKGLQPKTLSVIIASMPISTILQSPSIPIASVPIRIALSESYHPPHLVTFLSTYGYATALPATYGIINPHELLPMRLSTAVEVWWQSTMLSSGLAIQLGLRHLGTPLRDF